jgi:hypothetical protein
MYMSGAFHSLASASSFGLRRNPSSRGTSESEKEREDGRVQCEEDEEGIEDFQFIVGFWFR